MAAQSTDGEIQKEESEEEEESDEISDNDEEDAIEKAICKKFPEYKQVVKIIADLKKQFP